MVIPFILSVIAWPIVTFLSNVLISKLIMPLFEFKLRDKTDYKRADIFQALTLIISQVIVVFVAKGLYLLFQRQATLWLAIPFGLWCFIFGPVIGPIYDYLKAKYEGATPTILEKHLMWSWSIGLGGGWVISIFLLLA
jgi:hypothetical protein